MEFLRKNAKRIVIDAAGWLLIMVAILTGWLPGPGGLPLLVAGLGLLSINNAWAKQLRLLVMEHGGRLLDYLFPRWPWAEWAYDTIAVLLLALTFVLTIQRASIWQLGLAAGAFFIALFIALTNRDRLKWLRGQPKRKR